MAVLLALSRRRVCYSLSCAKSAPILADTLFAAVNSTTFQTAVTWQAIKYRCCDTTKSTIWFRRCHGLTSAIRFARYLELCAKNTRVWLVPRNALNYGSSCACVLRSTTITNCNIVICIRTASAPASDKKAFEVVYYRTCLTFDSNLLPPTTMQFFDKRASVVYDGGLRGMGRQYWLSGGPLFIDKQRLHGGWARLCLPGARLKLLVSCQCRFTCSSDGSRLAISKLITALYVNRRHHAADVVDRVICCMRCITAWLNSKSQKKFKWTYFTVTDALLKVSIKVNTSGSARDRWEFSLKYFGLIWTASPFVSLLWVTRGWLSRVYSEENDAERVSSFTTMSLSYSGSYSRKAVTQLVLLTGVTHDWQFCFRLQLSIILYFILLIIIILPNKCLRKKTTLQTAKISTRIRKPSGSDRSRHRI